VSLPQELLDDIAEELNVKQLAPLDSTDGGVVDVEVKPNAVRLIQQARRDADLDVSDRTRLKVAASGDLLKAIRKHEAFVSHETLAMSVDFVNEDDLEDATVGAVGIGGEIAVSVAKA
jgi:isoleucyl-tRNA synthetase